MGRMQAFARARFFRLLVSPGVISKFQTMQEAAFRHVIESPKHGRGFETLLRKNAVDLCMAGWRGASFEHLQHRDATCRSAQPRSAQPDACLFSRQFSG